MSATFARRLEHALFTIPCALISLAWVQTADAESGFRVETPEEGIQSSVEFLRFRYTGFCPGENIYKREAWFVSENTPPAPGRRVKVTNMTTGLDTDPRPYTDREYDEGSQSEHTYLFPAPKHREQTLSVVTGWNDFAFEITERGRLLERGVFRLNVSIREGGTSDRGPTCRWEPECWPQPIGGSVCRDRHVCECPR